MVVGDKGLLSRSQRQGGRNRGGGAAATALLVISALAVLPPAARGQQVPAVAPAAAGAVALPTQVESTALRPIDAETHTPMIVISRQELARMADLGLGELLQRLTFMGKSAPNLNSNAAGDGAVVADIGGMGPARCIVLLNGRRLPTDGLLGTPAVDLDLIPVTSLDRVEIFLGGASPAWGADAVSGVINLITRADTQGTDLTAAGSLSSHGDGGMARLSVHRGYVFGAGHLNLAAELRDAEPIDSNARDFSAAADPLDCAAGAACTGSTATPDGFVAVPAGNALNLPAGYYTSHAPGQWQPFRGSGAANDLYSTQTGTFLRDGRRGGSFTADLGLDLSERTELGVNLLIGKDRVQRQLAPLPLSTSLPSAMFPAATGAEVSALLAASSPVSVDARNDYNPFGVSLEDVRLRLTGLGPRRVSDDRDTELLSMSLRHAGERWQWEGTLSAGRSAVTEADSSVLNPGHLALALGPSGPDASGTIRCGLPDATTGLVATPIAGCVPFNAFEGQAGITQSMLSYISQPGADDVRQLTLQLSVLGRRSLALVPFLPPAQLAIGLDSWRAAQHTGTDEVLLSSASVIPPEGGTMYENDLLAEISQGAGTLNLDAGGRLASVQGRRPVPVGFVGLTWRPTPQWLLRGRFTQVYRAPTVEELFLGFQERVMPVSNPCAAGAPTASFCALNNSLMGTPASAQSDYFVSGNPALRPERGFSAGTGLVVSSLTDPARRLSLDVTWVHLEDAIRQPSTLELISACQGGAIAAACARIAVIPGSNFYAVNGSFINGGRDDAARVDARLSDAFTTSSGTLHAELLAGYLLSRSITDIRGGSVNLRGTFDLSQSVGGTAYPLLLARAHLDWQSGGWGAYWNADYIGGYRETVDSNGLPTIAGGTIRTVGSTLYQDVTLERRFGPLSARLSVENLLNRRPPRVDDALEDGTDAASYRLEGRIYALTLEMTF